VTGRAEMGPRGFGPLALTPDDPEARARDRERAAAMARIADRPRTPEGFTIATAGAREGEEPF
jgi:hypothetical protein